MSILQTIFEALQSLSANKMRTGLTILGIVIGVAAVIAMIAIGRGAEDSITGQINGIGTNLIFVRPGNPQLDVRNPRPLTLADAQAISDPLAAPSVAAVAPSLSGNLVVSYGSQSEPVSITGTTPDYARVANEEVTEGEFITQEQLLARSAVAVIGPDTAEALFGASQGVSGETIRIAGQPFRVTGVLKSKGGTGFGSQDNRILVPLTTAQVRLDQRKNQGELDMIQAQAVDSESVNSAMDEMAQILRTRHRSAAGLDDFTFMTQASLLDTVEMITGILTLFLGGVAAISLLVGGIGIMNIMLVSVTERTHEIGLRKALGARKRDVLIQFLTESILLSLVGGFVGFLLAWGICAVVSAIAEGSGTPINPVITVDAVLLATLFSVSVGLIFGLYPANRAARLQPVEALRYE